MVEVADAECLCHLLHMFSHKGQMAYMLLTPQGQ